VEKTFVHVVASNTEAKPVTNSDNHFSGHRNPRSMKASSSGDTHNGISLAESVSREGLTNAVESVFGRITSQDIAKDEQLVCATINTGFRLLMTPQKSKQNTAFIWRSFRRIRWPEITAAKRRGALSENTEDEHSLNESFVWHAVLHGIRRPNVATAYILDAYFLSNLHVVSDLTQEKFDPLVSVEEDDPDVIKAAMSDEWFVKVLQLYFESGDQHETKRFLTLSRDTLMGSGGLDGHCLLHYCCEHGFIDCVRLLLDRYTPLTAENGKPWLWLADPLFQSSQWGNSAFTIAVYRSDRHLLQVLWSWAQEHNQVDSVLSLVDSKGLNLLQLAADRLVRKAAEAHGTEEQAQNATLVHSFFAEAFTAGSSQNADNAATLPGPQADADPRNEEVDPMRPQGYLQVGSNLTSEPLHSIALPYPTGLQHLAQVVAELSSSVAFGSGVSLLVYRATFTISDTPAQDYGAALSTLMALRACSRVAVMKCVAPPGVCIAWADAVAHVLQQGTQWRSLRFPTFAPTEFEDDPSQEVVQFVNAMQGVQDAVRTTWAQTSPHLVSIDSDSKPAFSCIPLSSRHIVAQLSESFRMKKVFVDLMRMSQGGSIHWSATGYTVDTNPFLNAVVLAVKLNHSYRFDLNSGKTPSVQGALDPSWAASVRRTISTWMWQLEELHSLATVTPEVEGTIGEFVDRAVVAFLKLRSTTTRGGLDTVLAVRDSLRHVDVATFLPRTLRYATRRAIDLTVQSPSVDAHDVPADSDSDASTPAVQHIGGYMEKGKNTRFGRDEGKGKRAGTWSRTSNSSPTWKGKTAGKGGSKEYPRSTNY